MLSALIDAALNSDYYFDYWTQLYNLQQQLRLVLLLMLLYQSVDYLLEMLRKSVMPP